MSLTASTDAAPFFEIDFRSNEFAKDTYRIYALLRDQFPICKTSDGTYLLSRYDDVKFALTNYKLFLSGWGMAPISHPRWLSEECKRGYFLSEIDPPEHTQHSAIINKALMRRTIERLTPKMRAIAHDWAKKIPQMTDVDFLEDFAYPLVGSILDEVIGMNTGQSIEMIREWVDISESLTSEPPSKEKRAQIETIILQQNASYSELIRARRSNPKDDLVSALVHATVSDQGLSDKQLYGALNTFTLGGFDAPAQTIAHAVILFARRPDIALLLRNDPTQIGPFIEELIRLTNPAQGSMRITAAPVTLHGVTIPPHSSVLVLIGSANRDSHQFSDPDDFIISRPNIKTHVGFGHGIHSCIGAGLARAEIKVALEVLLENFDQFNCPADSELQWTGTVVGRVLRSLPVRFEPTATPLLS